MFTFSILFFLFCFFFFFKYPPLCHFLNEASLILVTKCLTACSCTKSVRIFTYRLIKQLVFRWNRIIFFLSKKKLCYISNILSTIHLQSFKTACRRKGSVRHRSPLSTTTYVQHWSIPLVSQKFYSFLLVSMQHCFPSEKTSNHPLYPAYF